MSTTETHIRITLADVACALVGADPITTASAQPLWLVLRDGRMVQVTSHELTAICRTAEGCDVPRWQLTTAIDTTVRALAVGAR